MAGSEVSGECDGRPGAAQRAATAPGFEERLYVLAEASASLLGSLDLDRVLPGILNLSGRLIAADAYAVWRSEEGSGDWRIVSSVGLSQEYRAGKIQALSDAAGVLNSVLPVEDVAGDALLAGRRELYRREGIRSLLAVPLRIHGQISGTITFYYRQPHRFSETDVRLAGTLANLASAAMSTAELHADQARHREEADEARRRSAFLGEASTLLASSLDYEATLASVARLAVPHVADWCVIDLVGEDGSLQRLALAHSDPSKMEWARELSKRYPPDPEAPGGAPKVVRTGISALVPEISDAMLVEAARNDEHLRLLRQVGFTSYMCVPLVARGRTLGALSFIAAESGRHYGPADLELAEDLARRAAIAVDNARLYAHAERERAALRQALAALRDHEQRLRLALEAGRMGIWDWDIRTNELRWSESLEPMHGFRPGTFDGSYRAFLNVIHPDDRPGVLAAIDRAVREGGHYEKEFRVVWPDGSVHWIMGMGQAFRDAAGEPVRMLGVGLETTERRRLEEQLRQAQKLESIGLLAGGVAHDFNNLLTGILGNASLAMEIVPPSSAARPLLDEAVCASERAADLTRQLLAYSGKGRFVIGPVDLSELVREISALLRVTLPKKVDLQLDLGSGLPRIEGDTSQIQQVIMNLVINGAEAVGEEPGRLVVRTGIEQVEQDGAADDLAGELPAGPYVFLEVRDTGCGFDARTRARIFDPFFTTKFTGRGLGLAAVSGIVRGHRGGIRVESAPGQGSTFRVLFPALVEGERAAGQPDAKLERMAQEELVLVVDDEDIVRRTARLSLERHGFRVLCAGDGLEGVELFRQHAGEIAVVLLDMAMPVLSGEEAVRIMKELRADVPVIASSGYSEMEASRRFDPGALAGFIQKPYTAAALAGKVKTVLAASARRMRA